MKVIVKYCAYRVNGKCAIGGLQCTKKADQKCKQDNPKRSKR